MISRRPIVNRQRHLAAYQLDSGNRDGQHNSQQQNPIPHAQWSFGIFDEFPLERLVANQQTFFSFSPALLETPPPLNRQQTVIVVPKSANIDAPTLHCLMLLRTKGYSIALDDFVLNSHTESLVAYADIISMDIEKLSEQELADTLEFVQLFGLFLLAKNIRNYSVFERCKNLGFNLFEGDFLTQPHISDTQTKGSAQQAEYKNRLIEMMSALHDNNAPLDKIERALSQDRQLSHKVLSLVNSAATGVVREVESLRQAIMLIGLDKLKNIANLLLLANIKDKPHELTVLALTRAHMCEVLALSINSRARSDSFFTVGLLSVIDAFLDEPLTTLLDSMGMPQHLADAIIHYSGNEGTLLKIVKTYEQAQWHKIDWAYLDAHDISAEILNRRYLETLEWVSDMMQSMGINSEH